MPRRSRADDRAAAAHERPGQQPPSERPAITDEELGLTPSGRQTGRPLDEPSDADLTAAERQRPAPADLGGVPDPALSGQFTGQPVAGRRSGSGAPEQAEVVDEEPDLTTSPHTLGAPGVANADVTPSLMDQEILTDPMAAPGDADDWRDPVAEGDDVYVPPTDPVVSSDAQGDLTVLGGFAPSAMDERVTLHSASDGQLGDEAIADAIRLALRQDSSTTDLQIDVSVEQGIARLRGTVPGLEDVDNAEAVAGRVPGVVDVVEELQIAEL